MQEGQVVRPFDCELVAEAERQSWMEELVRQMVVLLEVQVEERALDPVCGAGLLTRELAGLAHVVVGAEPEAELLRSANEAAARASLDNMVYGGGSCDHIYFPDASVDVVASLHAIARCGSPVLEEAARVLKPGGRAAFAVPAPPGEAGDQHDSLSAWLKTGEGNQVTLDETTLGEAGLSLEKAELALEGRVQVVIATKQV